MEEMGKTGTGSAEPGGGPFLPLQVACSVWHWYLHALPDSPHFILSVNEEIKEP
jgi:hypothetical protein